MGSDDSGSFCMAATILRTFLSGVIEPYSGIAVIFGWCTD